MLTWQTVTLDDEEGGRECKTGGEGGPKKVSVLPFISVICGNMCTQQNGTKSLRGVADDPVMPGATKEATLSAECGTRTTIVSLQ